MPLTQKEPASTWEPRSRPPRTRRRCGSPTPLPVRTWHRAGAAKEANMGKIAAERLPGAAATG